MLCGDADAGLFTDGLGWMLRGTIHDSYRGCGRELDAAKRRATVEDEADINLTNNKNKQILL